MTDGVTVLIVDDNEENRDILSRRLKADGFKIITAVDGKEAMTILSENIIHIVLLDIMMPEVDGFTLLSQIRADSTFEDMPVIMLTSIDIVTVAQECLRLGACGYVTKPYDMEFIKKKIRECLKMMPRLVKD
jgi:DNA-binding response OmpR family regulator